MRIALGWTLAAAMMFGGTAWGQAQPGAPAQPVQPRAGQAGQNAPGTRDAQPRENVNQPGNRRVDVQVGGQAAGGQPGRQAGQRGGSADAQIASMLALGNRNEIEISKFAQEHLQSDEAKEFAANMIKDHTPAMQRLQQFASQGGQGGQRRGGAANASDAAPAGAARRSADDATADNAADEARASRQRPADGAAEAGNRQRRPGLAWGQVHRELADQCLESTRKTLGEHQGTDFDKAYLGQQIVAHVEMKDKLTVLREHASSELQQELDKQLATTEEHLEHAKKLMHEKKDKPSVQATREERSGDRR